MKSTSEGTAVPLRDVASDALATAGRAWLRLVLSAGTGLLSLGTLLLGIVIALLSLIGIGLVLLRPWLLLLRAVAELERRRIRALGVQAISPYEPLPRGWRAALTAVREDPSTRRDLMWLPLHATWGTAISLFGVQAGINVLTDLTFPLWAPLLPAGEATVLFGLVPLDAGTGWPLAVGLGLAWAVVFLVVTPFLVRACAAPGTRLLVPHPDLDLSARITQLTATRAAALDAHAKELRRLERALHDGAQNRLVGVAMLTGLARESLHRDPGTAEAMMERAHTAAEDALAELRAVVRSILPPVLAARGLEGAMTALAADCAVPCAVEVDVPVPCPASVEATAYFVAAEALTNVSRHSGADRAALTVRRTGDVLTVLVHDDGRGGARSDGSGGTGLAGIRQRAAAHDGRTRIESPPGGPTRVEVELPCGS